MTDKIYQNFEIENFNSHLQLNKVNFLGPHLTLTTTYSLLQVNNLL